MSVDYEKLFMDELGKLSPELQREYRSSIASAEFEVDEFSFQEKYEMLVKVKETIEAKDQSQVA